ncbi:bestrophin family protein [Mucilaginibacter sp.]|jgi:putative membrane protein|uniref:bestrophin family protein n=1 Tax=Mucilaginibacter sp. TaxID=1882438 RepID=UPI003566758E
MIIRKKEHWFKMLFVWHGSVLPRILPRLSLLFLLSLIVVYLHGIIFSFKIPLNPTPLTLFGFVLALFLGFRNNVSYDRFWEGRKLWGALLNDTRSLARQALTLPEKPGELESARPFVLLLIAFTYALKHQLRHTDPSGDLQKRLNGEQFALIKEARFKPILIMKLMAQWVQQARQEKRLDTIQQSCFDQNFDKLSDIVGGCERIQSTPMPYSYRVLLHRTIYLYCFLLPFGLVDSLQWLTPFLVVFIAYTFVAFEAIADEIEQPFGKEPNDLALNAMCRMIESTLLEMIGENLPDAKMKDGAVID